MVQSPLHRLLLAAGENAAKRIGLTGFIKRVVGRGDCGGVRWTSRPLEENVWHVMAIATLIQKHLDVRDRVGVEIGPGDNLGAAYCLLKAGAQRIYAVEKLGSVAPDEWCQQLFTAIDARVPASPLTRDVMSRSAFTGPLRHAEVLFEEFAPDRPVDFVYSHDVIEHVDPPTVFASARKILVSGGDFLNIIDLTGHGVFYDLNRPLDFLTCPDWLWPLLFSAMETTNRVRWSELLTLADKTGFEVVQAVAIRRADPTYLAGIRPHLLPRYQKLADDDLSVMQCVLHLRKP